VLDVRVYRAAFLPALIALFVAAFSLADRPPPATTRQAADAFDGARAFGSVTPPPRNSLRELGKAFPDRAPASPGDAGLADRVAAALSAPDPATKRPLFGVTRLRTPGGARDAGELETVVGVRTGLSSRRVVVIANRDAASGPALAELSGTAALLELARDVRARELRKTLVLVSTSGGSSGQAGVRAWTKTIDPAQVDAVIVLGDLAGRGVRRPWVVPWPSSSGPVPLALQRTAENAVRREAGSQPGGARAVAQWIRRAVPATLSPQGPVAEAGFPAVTIGVSGERGPGGRDSQTAVSRQRLQRFGRGALRAVLAVDDAGGADAQAAFPEGTEGIVTLRNVLPDWAVRLVVGTLLLPALLTGLDAFFRIRRRKVPTAPWFVWLGAAAVPLLAAWLWARLLGLVGALDAPDSIVAPQVLPLDTGGAVALASTVLVAGLAWLAFRTLARSRLPKRARAGHPAGGGLAAASGLVLVLAAALAWAANPYLAALLLPAAHLWLFAAAPQGRLQGPAAVPAVLAGVVLPLLVVVYYALAFVAGPLALSWLALQSAAAGGVSPVFALVAIGWAVALAGVVRVVVAQGRAGRAAPPDPIRTRGPVTYAGPGSLGGTESALRR
jgi:hypothetical protein